MGIHFFGLGDLGGAIPRRLSLVRYAAYVNLIAWHGTLDRFDAFSQRDGFVSFATEPDSARTYAAPQHLGWTADSRLFKVDLKVGSILDFRRFAHVELVMSYLDKVGFDHFPRSEWAHWIENRGAYQCLEHPELLTKNRFDAVLTNEWGWLNIHVLDAALVEIVEVFDDDPGEFGLLGDGNCKRGWAPRGPSGAG